MRVALTFGFFGMLRQSNLAPPLPIHQVWQVKNTCRGDVIQAPPGLLFVIRWLITRQTVASSPVPPIPSVPGHPTNPVSAYHHLISTPLSSSPDHPLLSYKHGRNQVVVTVPMLASAFSTTLRSLDLDPALYSLHRLWRGRATMAHRQGLQKEMRWLYVMGCALRTLSGHTSCLLV